jgi:Cu(I)/Ag(I) efflux system membrane protein CusA/SilA
MLIYLDQALEEVKAARLASGLTFTKADLNEAIMLGAVERVRPKMMTVVAIMAGLLPILWSTGTGSEVMQRIAVPMIGGMVSSTVLTLIVIPAVYALLKGLKLPSQATGSSYNEENVAVGTALAAECPPQEVAQHIDFTIRIAIFLG